MATGACAGGLWLLLLTFPQRSELVAKGPMNVGHEGFDCHECHAPAPGNRAQQLSANVYQWIGLRASSVAFGSQDVASGACLECHERPNDRHPISRFLEPRFGEARRKLGVQQCMGCHLEHRGVRVTLPGIGYCALCHGDTELREDPIQPTHAELVYTEAWNTCLACHDFHGNHEMTTPMRLEDGVSEERVRAYFAGAPSPYSKAKRFKSLAPGWRPCAPDADIEALMAGDPAACR